LIRIIVQFFETVLLEVSNFLLNASAYFANNRRTCRSQKRRQNVALSHRRETNLRCFTRLLLFAWFVFSAATAILLVALSLPRQGGLSALLQVLGDLLPSDPVIYAT